MNCRRYKDYPNLFRVAQEMARCKNPDKVLNSMLTLLEGSVKDSTYGGEDFGLAGADVLPLNNSTR